MNSKTIEKILKNMGYTLRKTNDSEARWMVVSDVLSYHWNFKDLKSVLRFITEEKAMYRAAREYASLRS